MAGGTELQRRSSTAATLAVLAKAGHRHEIIDLAGDGFTAGKYTDINVGGKSVLRLYPAKNDMVLIGGHGAVGNHINILSLLKAKYPDIPLLYAGQDEDITVVQETAPTQQSIYFYDMTTGEIASHKLPGGSDGYPRPYIAWVSHSAAVTATGITKLDTSLAPTGALGIKDLYTFAGFNFRLLGIIFASAKVVASTPLWLRIFDGETFMFDDDRNGLMINADRNECKCDVTVGKLFLLERPHVFKDKTQIGLEMYCSHDGTNNITAGTELLGLVGLIEPLA